MENIYFNQIIELSEENLNTIVNWMYDWWGIEEGYTISAIECYMKHSLDTIDLPKTYGLFDGTKIIGICQLVYEDLFVRPDLHPWLANVYIDKAYRNKGLGKMLLNNINNEIKKLPYKEVYLYTGHKDLFEKFGWNYIGDIETHLDYCRIQRLYCFKQDV